MMFETVRMVTVREVAEFLRMKEATVCRLASGGQLPGLKIGKSWRFDMVALERLITGTQPAAVGQTVKAK